MVAKSLKKKNEGPSEESEEEDFKVDEDSSVKLETEEEEEEEVSINVDLLDEKGVDDNGVTEIEELVKAKIAGVAKGSDVVEGDKGEGKSEVVVLTDYEYSSITEVMEILRILTPQDITKMSSVIGGSKKIFLTRIMFADTRFARIYDNQLWRQKFEELWKKSLPEGNQLADAIRLEEEANMPDPLGPPVMNLLKSITPKIESRVEKEEAIKESKEVSVSGSLAEKTSSSSGDKASTEFFLEEKRKMRVSERKLRRKQFLENYRGQAKKGTPTKKKSSDDDKDREEGSGHKEKGTLFNKRHY